MIPLCFASPNEDVYLRKLRGGIKFIRHMNGLGLNFGAKMHIIEASQTGTMIIDVKDSRLALGRGTTHNIFVVPVNP
jgi:Fe2+ transport system protein FeoA